MFNRESKSSTKSNETLVCDSLTKFIELWKGRQTATFHLECWNGETTFHFSALLGHPEEERKFGNRISPRMSPSKIRRNKARAEAHAAKKNLSKNSVSSTSHVSKSENNNPVLEFGKPVQNKISTTENGQPALLSDSSKLDNNHVSEFGKPVQNKISPIENGQPAILSDSRKLSINHEEVAQKIVALAEMEHDTELFATKYGLNSKLLHKALSDLLYLHYGEHVLKQVQACDQYDDGSGEFRMPTYYNQYIAEENCKICEDLIEESHLEINMADMVNDVDFKISLRVKSCPLEYIASEKDHVRHMIMYHPEKVLEDEVAVLIGRAMVQMIIKIKAKLRERMRKSPICFTLCNVCDPQKSAICERNKCRCDKKCKHLQWLLIWTKKIIYVKRYNSGAPMLPSFSREQFGRGTVVSPTSSRRWHYHSGIGSP